MSASVSAKRRRISAVVAHPDDEVLGCGGALRRHVMAGDEVSILILADGETSRASAGKAEIEKRKSAAVMAAKALGIDRVVLHDFPDNRLDTVASLDIAKVIEAHIREAAPDTIYTHHSGDVNIDHGAVQRAVITACRPQVGQTVETLLFFEIPSSTEWQLANSGAPFVPNWFIDISDVLEAKMNALKAYDHEMRPWPHPRSYRGVESLARWRGATVGCEAAEAFILGRRIIR
jgi:LmbE family N-acetylglucosaminyl deacetylase